MSANKSPSPLLPSPSTEELRGGQPLPNSTKVYRAGKLHPTVRVPFRQITLSPSKTIRGMAEANESVCVYDCSGPWGDAAFEGDVEQGLPALRRPWILERGDIEEVDISYKPSTNGSSN